MCIDSECEVSETQYPGRGEMPRNSHYESLSAPTNSDIKNLMEEKFNILEESVKFNSDIMNEIKQKFDKLLLENHKLKKENEDIKTRVKRLEQEIEKLREIMMSFKKQKNLIMFEMATEDITRTNVLKVLLKCDLDVTENDFDIQVLPSKNSRKPTLVKFDKPEKCFGKIQT
ncbi:hypothetical protein WA026_013600 [Henosepilachna vigintioctopunctata]|uniref:Uncharacterized protein n=1 Tax=Henosepilachna vigintioctopunctata TaxID=420089 RepID=A0AAW1VG73_9CUCU